MEDKPSSVKNCHEEEMKGRITKDRVDRETLRKHLEISIDVLDSSQHADGLINIVTGKIASNVNVNVDSSAELGRTQVSEFENSLPDGFLDTIRKVIKTVR